MSDRQSPTTGNAPEDQPEDISLLELLNMLLRQRHLVLLVGLMGLVLFGGRVLLEEAEERFTASGTFVASGRTGGGGAPQGRGLAEQLGIMVGGGGDQSPQYFAALIESAPLLRQAVQEPYTATVGDEERSGTLVEIWGVGGATPEIARRRAANRLAGRVDASVDRTTGLVTVAVTTRSPGLSEQLVARLMELVQRYNQEARRNQAAAEADFVRERLDDARAQLREVEEELKSFLETNRQFQASPRLSFEHERLQRQVELRQEFFLSLLRSLERTRMEQMRDLPVIRVVESAEGSAIPEPTPPVLPMALLGLVLGVVLGVVAAFVREFFRRSREEAGSDYREFRQLRQESLADLSLPARWIRRWRRRASDRVLERGSSASGPRTP